MPDDERARRIGEAAQRAARHRAEGARERPESAAAKRTQPGEVSAAGLHGAALEEGPPGTGPLGGPLGTPTSDDVLGASAPAPGPSPVCAVCGFAASNAREIDWHTRHVHGAAGGGLGEHGT
jgi:hypothetical protein